MGNKNYSSDQDQPTFKMLKDYKHLYSIQDEQLGEIKVYKNLNYTEFLAFKAFIFVDEKILQKAIGQTKQTQEQQLQHFVRLIDFGHFEKKSLCNTTYNLELVFEYHPNRLCKIFNQVNKHDMSQLSEECLKYLIYVLMQCVTYLLQLGRKAIDISLQNVFLDQQYNFKYLEIYALTKVTQYERIFNRLDAEEDICLSPEQLTGLKQGAPVYVPQDETYLYNIGMICLQLMTMQQSIVYYNNDNYKVDTGKVLSKLTQIQGDYSIEFLEFIKGLLRLTNKEVSFAEAQLISNQWGRHKQQTQQFLQQIKIYIIYQQRKTWVVDPEGYKELLSRSRLQITQGELEDKIISPKFSTIPQFVLQNTSNDEITENSLISTIKPEISHYINVQENPIVEKSEDVAPLSNFEVVYHSPNQSFFEGQQPNQKSLNTNTTSYSKRTPTTNISQIQYPSKFVYQRQLQYQSIREDEELNQIQQRAKYLIEKSKQTITRLQEQGQNYSVLSKQSANLDKTNEKRDIHQYKIQF